MSLRQAYGKNCKVFSSIQDSALSTWVYLFNDPVMLQGYNL